MTEWHEWSGESDVPPVASEMRVDVKFRNGEQSNYWHARAFDWTYSVVPNPYDIVAWREA